MDKIWYAERIKECKSVKPEIVRLLKEEFKISDKDFDCIMYDIESQYHSTPDTLLRMAILNKCAKRGYDYEECEHYLAPWRWGRVPYPVSPRSPYPCRHGPDSLSVPSYQRSG